MEIRSWRSAGAVLAVVVGLGACVGRNFHHAMTVRELAGDGGGFGEYEDWVGRVRAKPLSGDLRVNSPINSIVKDVVKTVFSWLQVSGGRNRNADHHFALTNVDHDTAWGATGEGVESKKGDLPEVAEAPGADLFQEDVGLLSAVEEIEHEAIRQEEARRDEDLRRMELKELVDRVGMRDSLVEIVGGASEDLPMRREIHKHG